ncbi:zinc finger protein ZFP2 isoform X2 [Leguminivora glycinivorella]|uniref:zinc finger protein ZFP2 isoform X2 n=1 Tax=Leguminivora glycinivorella TaxID=1035111 RepID=UPI00200E1D0C|nr:zinc finger protein ZFP2 isoform X2 [Leguminivora glycinivorella]
MSADAASLPCPICFQSGVFESVQSLRDRLIHVSTNKILCPVCQEEVCGLDKLTIHLFTHVKLINTRDLSEKNNELTETCKPIKANIPVTSTQQKKSRTSTAKNKPSTSTANAPVKFVKICPKLPVMPANTAPVLLDTSREPAEGGVQEVVLNVSSIKKEKSQLQANTTCDICGIQFVDEIILRMHRCLIHNIDDNSNHSISRYQCHLCPKNFKMRGSLMVHLRVAHYGFQSDTSGAQTDTANEAGPGNHHLAANDNPSNYERNDNKQWQCDVCRKCFTTKYFLKKHKRLHTGETPYACSQCNKTFTFQQSYHKHLLYHNDDKPHTCSYCGRAFKELSTLHNHQRIHTGEKPFSCETCGKCFRQRVSYLVHRRIHTGVMPYKCTACDKSFRYKVSQRTHKCQAQPPEFPKESCENIKYHQVSEANAELVRTGAKLSLEDTETDHFTLIAEAFNENIKSSIKEVNDEPNIMLHESNGSVIDKNIPSPSETFKNLCLSKEDDYNGVQQEKYEGDYAMYKEFNLFL